MIYTNKGSKTALITKEKKYTYKQLSDKINQYSILFNALKSTKIAIFSENREEWIFAFYAGWNNNCTIVPIDYLSSVEDISFILNDCKPELVFVSLTTQEKIEETKLFVNHNFRILNFDTIKENDLIHNEYKWIEPTNKEETAVIIYTSGTTGKPKGVMLSYLNLEANIRAVSKDVEIYTENRQVLMLLPLHHIFPLAGSMLAPLSVGGTIVMSPSVQSTDILDTLKNNKINIIIGVPRFYELLYNGIRNKINASFVGKLFYSIIKLIKNKSLVKKIFKKVHDSFGGNLEYFVSGGAALNKEIAIFFKTLGFSVLEGYGMTEAAPMITFPRPDNVKIGAVGQVLPGLEVQILKGEIVAKGPNIMKGYYNNPKDTSDVLKNGWLYTGDLGRMDKDGFLYITGRKKEILVLPNGKNINPVELEEKLLKNEFIEEAGVFLKDGVLHAVILPDYSKLFSNNINHPLVYFKEEVIPGFNKNLSPYKRIIKYSLIKESIPRTRLGKIQRFKLPGLFEKPVKQKKSDPTNISEEYKIVKTFIEKQVNIEISQEDHLEFDIALDSLGKISLLDFIERTFGVKIKEESLLKFPSVGEMVDYIKNNKTFQNLEKINWDEILKEKVKLKLPKTWCTLPFLIKLSKFFLKLYFKLSTNAQNKMPKGAAIITPNHQSFLDALLVTASFKKSTIKETYFYAKKKHIKTKLFEYFAGKNNVIIMDINNDLKQSIQKMATLLQSGKKILIFPEGTRTTNGELGEFKKTFAILSKTLNVPVIPVAISGAYNALPKGNKIPKPFAPIKVNCLTAVYPDDYTIENLTDKVKQKISAHINV